MESARIYLGGVPDSLSGEDIYKHLSLYGRILEIKLRPGYGFVQFERQRDALDVVRAFSGQKFLGFDMNVQLARPLPAHSPELDSPRDQQAGRAQMRYAVVVDNLNTRTCWQELKDFGRSAGGTVAFCDVDRDSRTRGWINYTLEEDAERAVRELDGAMLLGNIVRLERQYHKDGEYPRILPRMSLSLSRSRREQGGREGNQRSEGERRRSHEPRFDHRAREPANKDTRGRGRAFSGSSAVRPYPNPHNTGGSPALPPDRALPHEYAMGAEGHRHEHENSTSWQFR